MSKAFDNLMKKAFNEDLPVTRNRAEEYFRTISNYFGGDGRVDYADKHKVKIYIKDGKKLELLFDPTLNPDILKIKEIVLPNGKTFKINKEIASIKDVGIMFKEFRDLTPKEMSKISKVYPKSVSEFRSMWKDYGLISIDVKYMTSMEKLFYDYSLSGEDLDIISAWDVSNVETMEGMFFNTRLSPRRNDVFNSWDVSNVKNMAFMFNGVECSMNLDLSHWDVSNVESMSHMFKLADISFNISSWNTSSVKSMSNMFAWSKFNHPINNWNVSSVEKMREMFRGATSFNQPLEKWDISNVKDMSNMFCDAKSFNQPLNSWNIDNKEVTRIFDRCPIKEEYKPGAKPKASNNEEPEVSSSGEPKASNNEEPEVSSSGEDNPRWVKIKHCCVGTILDPNTTPSLQVILDLLNQEDLGFHFTKENTRGGGLEWYFFIAGGYKALVFGLSDGVEILADEETAQNVYENLKRVIDRTFKYSRRIKIRDEDDLHSALAELSGFLVEGETLSENDLEFDGDEEDAEELSKVLGISAYQLMKEKHDPISYILEKGNPEWHAVKESFKSYSNSIFGRILERVY